ncbi:hypothetical protein F383_31137 [Gossypium arboreum]|uniref:Uncharacterized protein n=1 Tax=Gossypium arboreum TaxID=29729 RepID=A0A0B0PIR2_GOSAR|nr:hypothetical protein F383_31137 [Gossypium arboreum]
MDSSPSFFGIQPDITTCTNAFGS